LNNILVRKAKKPAAENEYATSSVIPEVELAIRFIEDSGNKTTLTSIDNALLFPSGNGGTVIIK